MKKFVFNAEDMKAARIALRRNQTQAEKVLWEKLRRKTTGHKWYRQYSVGKFILDFYCPKLKLALEVDGPIHMRKNAGIYDQMRSEYLHEHGITVKRFTNDEILFDRKPLP
jgi:very-short-patch-repair endonuclease